MLRFFIENHRSEDFYSQARPADAQPPGRNMKGESNMANKMKRLIYLVLIFGGFAVLHNFVPAGLDQAGWDGFLVLFVTVLLWLTEAVPMAITSIFALFISYTCVAAPLISCFHRAGNYEKLKSWWGSA